MSLSVDFRIWPCWRRQIKPVECCHRCATTTVSTLSSWNNIVREFSVYLIVFQYVCFWLINYSLRMQTMRARSTPSRKKHLASSGVMHPMITFCLIDHFVISSRRLVLADDWNGWIGILDSNLNHRVGEKTSNTPEWVTFLC